MIALCATNARAFEFFDGRLQIHGFYEAQIRSIMRDFSTSDGWDLTQFYHVLNVEIEADVAPDGFGPFDLVSMFGRVEVRYDCVWTRACGVFSSADTYGDRANRLPGRLSDGRRAGLNGHLRNEAPRRNVAYQQDSNGDFILDGNGEFIPERRRPFDTVDGPDTRRFIGIPRIELSAFNILDLGFGNGTANASDFFDVPGITNFFSIRGIDGLLSSQGPIATGGSFIIDDAMDPNDGELAIRDVGNDGGDDPAFIAFGDFIGKRCVFGVQKRRGSNAGRGSRTLPHDPACRIDPTAKNASKPNPFLGPNTVDRRVDADGNPVDPTTFGTAIVNSGPQLLLVKRNVLDPTLPTINNREDPGNLFFPTLSVAGDGNIILGEDPDIDRVLSVTPLPGQDVRRDGHIALNGYQAGFGELPLRPAPLFGADLTAPGDDGEFGTEDDFQLPWTAADARGIWIPNESLARNLRAGNFDDFDQNFRQSELEWNRGASQEDEKELKELYVDLELFDSRLWVRAGKQQIVWGKTELFRTTDQFNPQDFALASLPSLEESRIGLWAIRGVWSFYDVGPLEDVRLEIAVNYDDFEPADLGRCGEPYTPLPVCDKTFGLLAHGITGVALAGERRPEDPWNSWDGIEVGARAEWRWDRFSFAFTNFYGFNDTPYADQIFAYSRNVDPVSGRPRHTNATGSCNTDVFAGDFGAQRVPKPTPDPEDFDPACLTPVNALTRHSINQTIFHLVCGSSIGFTQLDTTVCGQTIFNSSGRLLAIGVDAGRPPVIDLRSDFTIAQALSNVLVGNPIILPFADQPVLGGPFFSASIVPLNRDVCDDFLADCTTSADAVFSNQIDEPHILFGGAAGVPSANTALTSYQKALLGCGEFYGTNCEIEGIDLMNAEASVIMQSWMGIEGTGIDGIEADTDPDRQGNVFNAQVAPGTYAQANVDPFTGRPRSAGAPIWYFDDLANGNGDGVFLPNSERRPVGTRAPSASNPSILQILPGARGANALGITGEEAFGGDDDLGYDPERDGCSGPIPGTDCIPPATGGRPILPADYVGSRVLRHPFAGRDPGANGRYEFEGLNGVSAADVDDFYRMPDGSVAQVPCDGLTAHPDCAAGASTRPATFRYESPYIFVSEMAALSWNFQAAVAGLSQASNEDQVLEDYYIDLEIEDDTFLPVEILVDLETGMPVTVSTVDATDDGLIPGFQCTDPMTGIPDPDCVDIYESNHALDNFPARIEVNNDGIMPGFQNGGCVPAIDNPCVDPFENDIVRNLTGDIICDPNDPTCDPDDPGAGGMTIANGDPILDENGDEVPLIQSFDARQESDIDSTDFDPNNSLNTAGITGAVDSGFFDRASGPFREDACSFANLDLCNAASAFWAITGVQRNSKLAGGSTRFGRRDFIWQGGSVAQLRYKKRNVMGLSVDVAEDFTKSNWSFEFTWINDLPTTDNNSPSGISEVDTFNLTVSIDRPTFINFLNANRTFFINSQWFFQYISGYGSGFTEQRSVQRAGHADRVHRLLPGSAQPRDDPGLRLQLQLRCFPAQRVLPLLRGVLGHLRARHLRRSRAEARIAPLTPFLLLRSRRARRLRHLRRQRPVAGSGARRNLPADQVHLLKEHPGSCAFGGPSLESVSFLVLCMLACDRGGAPRPAPSSSSTAGSRSTASTSSRSAASPGTGVRVTTGI